MESKIAELDLRVVRDHFDERRSTHQTLRKLFVGKEIDGFVQLALGMSNPFGNFSAAEHRLGPRILSESSANHVFELASAIEACPSPNHLPGIIYRQGIPYLKVSVGTEIAMMLKPDVHWVANVRSIWAHLFVKHGGDRSKANEALRLYRDGERDSEMEYQIWRDVYLRLEPDLRKLVELGNEAAAAQQVAPGELTFLWADAIADTLYNRFAETGRR